MNTTLKARELDWGLWAFMLLAAAFCHLVWELTVDIVLDFRSIAFFIWIFAGYKFGRWPGAVLGLLSSLVLLACAWLGEDAPTVMQSLFGPVSYYPFAPFFGWRDFSLQDALMAGAFGFFGGWALDRLESFLGRPLSSFLTKSPDVGPLRRAYDRIGRMLWPDPDAAKQIGATTWQMLLTPAVFVLLPLLNFTLAFTFEPLTLSMFPPLLAAIMIGIIAWRAGFGHATAASVWLVVSSWFVYVFLLGEEGVEGFRSEGVELWLSIRGPEHLLGLLVLAWWLAQVSAALSNTDLRDYWRSCGDRLVHATPVQRRPSVAFWVVLLIFLIGFEIAIGTLKLTYVPAFGLFFVLAWLAARREAVSVSRQAFWLLFVLGVMSFTLAPVDVLPNLKLFTFSPNAVELVLLAATPLIATKLDLSQIGVSRSLCLGFIAAWTLANGLIGGFTPNELSMVILKLESEVQSNNYGFVVTGTKTIPLPLLGWLATLALAELGARVLTWNAPGQSALVEVYAA